MTNIDVALKIFNKGTGVDSDDIKSKVLSKEI